MGGGSFIGGEWLVDGALVNSAPVSVCRAMGARMVIAINLNADIIGKAGHPDEATRRCRGHFGAAFASTPPSASCLRVRKRGPGCPGSWSLRSTLFRTG